MPHGNERRRVPRLEIGRDRGKPGFPPAGGQFVYDFRKPVIRKAVHRDVNSLLCFPNFGNIKLFEIFPW